MYESTDGGEARAVVSHHDKKGVVQVSVSVHVLEIIDKIVVRQLQSVVGIVRHLGVKQEGELARALRIRPVDVATVV